MNSYLFDAVQMNRYTETNTDTLFHGLRRAEGLSPEKAYKWYPIVTSMLTTRFYFLNTILQYKDPELPGEILILGWGRKNTR